MELEEKGKLHSNCSSLLRRRPSQPHLNLSSERHTSTEDSSNESQTGPPEEGVKEREFSSWNPRLGSTLSGLLNTSKEVHYDIE